MKSIRFKSEMFINRLYPWNKIVPIGILALTTLGGCISPTSGVATSIATGSASSAAGATSGGGGGGTTDPGVSAGCPSTGTAVVGDVLSGKTFPNTAGTLVTGTMTNHGAFNLTGALGSAGYVSSLTGLTPSSVCSTTSILGSAGTASCISGSTVDAAAAANIQSGKECWNSSGSKITGSLAPTASSICTGTTIAGVSGTGYCVPNSYSSLAALKAALDAATLTNGSTWRLVDGSNVIVGTVAGGQLLPHPLMTGQPTSFRFMTEAATWGYTIQTGASTDLTMAADGLTINVGGAYSTEVVLDLNFPIGRSGGFGLQFEKTQGTQVNWQGIDLLYIDSTTKATGGTGNFCWHRYSPFQGFWMVEGGSITTGTRGGYFNVNNLADLYSTNIYMSMLFTGLNRAANPRIDCEFSSWAAANSTSVTVPSNTSNIVWNSNKTYQPRIIIASGGGSGAISIKLKSIWLLPSTGRE